MNLGPLQAHDCAGLSRPGSLFLCQRCHCGTVIDPSVMPLMSASAFAFTFAGRL